MICSFGKYKIVGRYIQGTSKIHPRYIQGICKIYVGYIQSILGIRECLRSTCGRLLPKGRKNSAASKKIRVYRKSVIICKVMNHYAEKSPKNDFQGRGKVRASKTIVRR